MPVCVPIKDLRNTAAFDELVEKNSSPIIVTKNGYDRFVCVKSAEYDRLSKADARVKLLERIVVAERERAEGSHVDAFEALDRLREKYGA